jgi:hypothetical protein
MKIFSGPARRLTVIGAMLLGIGVGSVWVAVFLLAPGAWAAEVTLVPGAARVSSGQKVTVEVRVADAAQLLGYQMDVGYRGDIVKLVKVGEGGFLKSDGASTFFLSPTAADRQKKSKVTVAATRVGGGSGVSGSGTLAVLTFEGTPKAGKGRPVKALKLSVVPRSLILVQE